jgi:hypothetical protein
MSDTDRVVHPMNAEDNGAVIGYMCLIDFQCELGAALGGNIIYPDPDDCREHRKCIEGCGMVEVEVRFCRVVQEPGPELPPEISNE